MNFDVFQTILNAKITQHDIEITGVPKRDNTRVDVQVESALKAL